MKTNLYLIVLTISLILISCENEFSAFKKAQKVNTIEALDAYIKNYPEKGLISEAVANIIKLHLDTMSNKYSMVAYDHIIEKYQNILNSDSIQRLVMEVNYQDLINKDSVEILQHYVLGFPESPRINDVSTMLMSVYSKKMQNLSTIKEKQLLEDEFVKYILEHGVAGRFRLEGIKPRNNRKSNITFRRLNENLILFTKYYPKDQIILSMGLGTMVGDGEMIATQVVTKLRGFPYLDPEPMGNNSVHRFIGDIKVNKDISIKGDTIEPIALLLNDKNGYIYLHGKGEIYKNDSLVIKLP